MPVSNLVFAILFGLICVVAAIMAIHALGGLDYHPTQAEADYLKARSR